MSFEKILFAFMSVLVFNSIVKIWSIVLCSLCTLNHKDRATWSSMISKNLALITIIFNSKTKTLTSFDEISWWIVQHQMQSIRLPLFDIHIFFFKKKTTQMNTIHVITSYFFMPTIESNLNWKCKRKLNG